MNHKYWSSALVLLALTACRAPLAISGVQTQKNISITDALTPDADYMAVIAPYKKDLDSKMNTRLSFTSVDLNKQGDNSNLGNLLADFTLQGAAEWANSNGRPPVDAAVINIGGIRTSIGKGDILTRHIYEVMPFENEVVIMKLDGKRMDDLFEFYRKYQKNNPVSGLFIETDGSKLISSRINGELFDKNRTYYIATSDYLAGGGDNMQFFAGAELIPTGIKMRDLFIEKFRATPQVVAPKDLRLQFKNKSNGTQNE